MKFPEFIERKFLEWQNEQGRRKSTTEFAAYLGISQPLLSMWMSGLKKPGQTNIKLLVRLFGLEVYDALGLPRPDENLSYLELVWDTLKPEHRKAIREQAERYYTKNDRSKKN